MHVQGSEICIFAGGKQGLICLPSWWLALTIRVLTVWEWFSVADVISVLINHLPALRESAMGTLPCGSDPCSAADVCPCPSKWQSCWALLLLDELGSLLYVCLWILFWLEILSLQAVYMLLWKVLLLTNIFLAKMLICTLWHFSAFHRCSKLHQTTMLYVTACIDTLYPPKEFCSCCPLH